MSLLLIILFKVVRPCSENKIRKSAMSFVHSSHNQYEITNEEWQRIKDYLPPERSGQRGRPSKDNRNDVRRDSLGPKKRSAVALCA